MRLSMESWDRLFNDARIEKGLKHDIALTFVSQLYRQLDLPLETFANQVGVEPQTVRLWLRKAGNLPSKRAQRRLLALYERNNSLRDVETAVSGVSGR
jgi:hypothetical protein